MHVGVFPQKKGAWQQIFHRPHKRISFGAHNSYNGFFLLIFFFRLDSDMNGTMPISWSTLNPIKLVEHFQKTMSAFNTNFEFDSFEKFMKTVRVFHMESHILGAM